MKGWDRALWGVAMRAKSERPTLIGSLWHRDVAKHYSGEPTRPLLFTSRAAARQWCKQRSAETDWRFSVVGYFRFLLDHTQQFGILFA